MNIFTVFGIIFLVVVGLPVLSYMITKFGAAGYFRAKRRNEKQQKENQ